MVRHSACAVAVCTLLFDCARICAQPADTVAIDYPEELPLEALVDYVSQTLGVQILYGENLKELKVSLRPGHIELPKDRLLELLRSVLSIRGLALMPEELPGFYRVVKSAEVQRLAGDVRAGPALGEGIPGKVVTQLIAVPSGDVKSIAAKVTPFLSFDKAALIEVPERGSFLVTDYEPVVARIAKLVELIDVARPVVTELVPVQHQDADKLAKVVTGLMPESAAGRPEAVPTTLTAGLLPGIIVVTGQRAHVERASELVRKFDVLQEDIRPTRTYTPAHASAARFKALIENVAVHGAGVGKESLGIFIDDALNRLYVTAPPAVHQQIESLLAAEDKPLPASSRRMRIYQPRNRSAGEILDTLTQLLEEATVSVLEEGEAPAGPTPGAEPRIPPPGPNRPPATPGQVPPVPPAQEPQGTPEKSVRPARRAQRVQGPDYVLTEDEATNAIIAFGSPEFHAQLASLIESLDRRQPQVLIEMTLVAVSLTDSLNLGVELEALDIGDGWDYLLFSSFGLSTVDPVSGQRVLTPGVGANGVLVAPDETPALFQALATHGNNRVVSTPRVVVSDNTTATLRNVDEAPFVSVNASDTVATTSFGGFESAGTTLTVTPRVAEGDHLTLVYNLTFSNFTGAAASNTAPPPRTTNSFTGEVSLPDGYTVVVGGLIVENESDTVSEVPLLGRIPLLGLFFQSSAASRSRSKIFAFIRPVILRDDEFKDLKYYSTASLKEAEAKSKDFPEDRPSWMR